MDYSFFPLQNLCTAYHNNRFMYTYAFPKGREYQTSVCVHPQFVYHHETTAAADKGEKDVHSKGEKPWQLWQKEIKISKNNNTTAVFEHQKLI